MQSTKQRQPGVQITYSENHAVIWITTSMHKSRTAHRPDYTTNDTHTHVNIHTHTNASIHTFIRAYSANMQTHQCINTFISHRHKHTEKKKKTPTYPKSQSTGLLIVSQMSVHPSLFCKSVHQTQPKLFVGCLIATGWNGVA